MTYGNRLRATSLAAALVLLAAFCLAFFSAKLEADQGFSQKIFYVHVPMAIVALGGFVYGGIMAIQHLRTGLAKYDLRSYVAIHLSVVLGIGVLLTGAIWAKAAWGVWFEWREPTLVSFLIVFLLYCTYQPLRFSIEDPEKQSRYASVFAVTAGAFVPLNFLAVRLADPVHPPARAQPGRRGSPGLLPPAVLPRRSSAWRCSSRRSTSTSSPTRTRAPSCGSCAASSAARTRPSAAPPPPR